MSVRMHIAAGVVGTSCACVTATPAPVTPSAPPSGSSFTSDAAPICVALRSASRVPCDTVVGRADAGFHVVGHVDGAVFFADSDVLGDELLASSDTSGTRGWLELTSLRFSALHVARAPVPPWIDGVMTADGFVPSSRVVSR